MTLFIHNTLTNKKEEFIPIEKGKVRMYVCGVTVYDDIHMGHARSMIVFDMVARYLRYSGYEVTHVTNFTDVDDKIIIRAAERGIQPLELSKQYIDAYFRDIEKLGIKGELKDGIINNPQLARQIALGTGAGVRLDLDGLVVRLDLGVGIHAPYQTYRYAKDGKPDLTQPITGYFNIPSFFDALRLNFGIGYPF